MKRRNLLSVFALSALVLGGCAAAQFPLTGFVYTEGKGPIAAEQGTGSKSGKACATSILGIVATGDASIEAAKANGGITTLASVDHSSKSILGLYAEFCTIATGS